MLRKSSIVSLECLEPIHTRKCKMKNPLLAQKINDQQKHLLFFTHSDELLMDEDTDNSRSNTFPGVRSDVHHYNGTIYTNLIGDLKPLTISNNDDCDEKTPCVVPYCLIVQEVY